jgi:hypothetical protein
VVPGRASATRIMSTNFQMSPNVRSCVVKKAACIFCWGSLYQQRRYDPESLAVEEVNKYMRAIYISIVMQ